MKESKDKEIIEMRGATIRSWDLAFETKILFNEGNKFCDLTVSRFLVGKASRIKPFNAPQAVEKEMKLIEGKKILSAVITGSGELHLDIQDDLSLIAYPEEKVEAWELRWLNKTYIALPGGGWDSWDKA